VDLILTEEQSLIATTARELLAARSPTAGFRAVADGPTGYSTGLWREMAELGWIGLALPEEQGGGGGTFLDLCLLVEEMGRVLVVSPFVPTVLGVLALARFGTTEQREGWIPRAVGGECVIGYAGPAWSTRAGEVRARVDGDEIVIDGSTTLVPYAHVADLLLVAARIEGDADPVVILVGRGAEGMDLEELDAVDLHRQYRVAFRDVRVPAGSVLGGGPGRGPGGRAGAVEAIEVLEAFGGAALCSEMVGGAQRVLDLTVEYASVREQFGRAIGSFQAVQHHCADMATDVLTSRYISHEAQWRLSRGLDAHAEVSMAKAWVSDAYRRVCALGHQVHGAIGFTREHDLHLYLRHAIASELTFGDADHHRGLLAGTLGL